MFFAHENMKKMASKVAEPAHIQPKSQFLFHKNLPPHDFSIMTLPGPSGLQKALEIVYHQCGCVENGRNEHDSQISQPNSVPIYY